MILQNLHTHTRFGDGKNTAEEMVRGALKAGCASLGFSEHSPLPPAADPDGWSMSGGDVSGYRAEILRLQEACRGRMEIFLGLEQDLDSSPLEQAWDYIIGSVHSLRTEDGRYLSVDGSAELLARAVREHFGGDALAFAEAYYRREATVAEKTGCQIVGHFDLVTKFNEGGSFFDENCRRYQSAALEALEALLERNVIFELNTGAISRGYRTAPYPAPFLLRAIHAKGGRICISSDAHSAESVICAFCQAAELAEECGFQETWVLTRNGFQAVGLEDFRKEVLEVAPIG